MVIRFCLFDLGDTLLWKPALFQRIADILGARGREVSPERIRAVHTALREERRFPPRPDRGFYLAFNLALLAALGFPRDLDVAEGLFGAVRDLPWEPFADVALLESWPVPMGILSNWDASLQDMVRKHLPFPFRFVEGSAGAGIAKPDPAFFLRGAALAGVAPEEVLYVGDSPSLDAAPAASAGMGAVVLDRFGLHASCGHPTSPGLKELRREMARHG